MRGPKALWRAGVGVTVLAALVLAGCGGGGGTESSGPPQKGGTLRIGPEAEIATLDPAKVLGATEINILGQTLQGLFISNHEEKIEPLLVTKYEKTPDLKEWTFHLREGVKFSNGRPMTSADVVFSIEAAQKSLVWGNLYEGITSIKADGPSTVVIKTKAPAPALPAVLSLFAAGIVPKNYAGMSEQQFGEEPIGTGPFEVVSWKRGTSITLEKNPYYWQKGLPYLEKVIYTPAPSDNSRVSQLKAGQLDAISKPAYAQLKSLESFPGVNLNIAENSSMGTLLANARKPLFQDPRAREAINLAVDREDIATAALKGYGRPAASFFPLSMLYAKDLKPPARDVAKAKKLLAEAVAATGEQPDFEISFEAGEESASSATQVIQENLEEAGFKITLKPLEATALYGLAEAGEFDLALINFFSTLHDPVEQVGFYPATEGFWTGASNVPEFTKKADAALEEINPTKRGQMYGEIQEEVEKENYVLVVDNAPLIWATAENVSGFEINAVGAYNLLEVGFSK
jgi:peptide/nickel transport system substrate-binding protein